METPQPSRPLPEGRKATHDFLSLYTHSPVHAHSPVQHDQRPSHGGCLKTHNFLQPLEKEDKIISVKDDNTVDINVEKPPPQAPPLLSTEHVLPGGIRTYSLSHISYFNQRMPKAEGTIYALPPAATSSNDRNNENSNCSSYTAGSDSGFTLWEESPARKGKAGKEHLGDVNVTEEPMVKSGQWPTERPSESSSNHHNSYCSRSSSQPPAQKSQSFMDMLKSARGRLAKEEEDDEGFTLGKEGSTQRGELRVKVDEKKSNDQKANTPRSKHSATEQRRRCKINDRFQALRELIPRSDQKRDKASFLLEVIEYIQFLQEKVSRYAGSYPGWSSGEPTKVATWRSSPNLTEGFPDQPRNVSGPVLMFSAKPEENVFPAIAPRKQQNLAESDILSRNNNNNNAVAFNAMDQQNMLTNKSAPSVPTTVPSQPEIFAPFRNDNGVIQPALRKASDADHNSSRSQLQLWQSNQQQPACSSVMNNDHLHHQELAVEGGTISISSIYSQGLLRTLTQALQSSGVDLSQASISVQVDIGKRANGRQNAQRTTDKDGEVNCNGRALVRERGVENSGCGDCDQATKRLKKMGSR